MTTNSIVRIYVAVALFTISFIFGGCSTPVIYDLIGILTCSNCGVSKDGLLRIESDTSLRSLNITITNLSDEPIYLDERYCSFTDSNEVQPLKAWLTNATTKGTSLSYEWSEATTRPQYDLFALFGLSNRTTGSSFTTEVTNQVVHNPIVIIPKKSRYTLTCNDWYGYLFNTIKRNSTSVKDKYGNMVLDTITMKRDVELLRNRPMSFTLVYRKLNDTQWSNATVTLQSPDISMTAITKKSKSSKK